MSDAKSKFSLRDARTLVSGLQRPQPWIYWLDFTASAAIGHMSFLFLVLMFQESTPSTSTGIFTAVALFSTTCILYMRCAMFIHELVHLPKDEFKGFRVWWNLLCGIPFLIPSFLYYPHVDHHRRKHYGTDHDGEYLDLSHRHPSHILLFVVAAVVVPIAAFVRFAIMSPLAWLFPSFQKWVERHASSMIIDIFYLRGDYGPRARRVMRIQEIACFAWCMFLVFRTPIMYGTWFDVFIPLAYAVSVVLILINNIRTLGAHRWIGDGRELTFEQQLLDSVNYPYRAWITELWGPTGTRYHALHHLFPGIPYHNLGKAHRRLAAGVPADSPYHETTRVSLFMTIVELWQRAAHRKAIEEPSADNADWESHAA